MRRYGIVIPSLILSVFCAHPSMAQDQDHACQVLLCLATPGSPTTYAECVPPITKLYEDLAKGKAFPTCGAAGNAMEISQPVSDPYYCDNPHVLSRENAKWYCRSLARAEVDCPPEQLPEGQEPSPGLIRSKNGEKEVCQDFQYSVVHAYPKPTYIDVKVKANGQQTRIRY